jgi:hypothetical protein
MNRNRLETLKENIDKLDSHEHSQIFDVIRRYTEQYTKTGKSIFVSTDTLPLPCLEEIEKLVSFYLDQRKSLTRRPE